MTYIPNPAYNNINRALRSEEIDPLNQGYVSEKFTASLGSTAETYHYIDMAGFRKAGFQFYITMGTDSSAIVTIEGSLADDGTIPAECTYIDITSDTFGVASLVCGAGAVTQGLWIDNTEKLACYKYLRIKIYYTHSQPSTSVIHHRRLY